MASPPAHETAGLELLSPVTRRRNEEQVENGAAARQRAYKQALHEVNSMHTETGQELRRQHGVSLGATPSAKNIASLQGLIAQAKSLKRPRDEDKIDGITLHTRPESKSKSPLIAQDFFAKYRLSNSGPRPNYLAEATKAYYTAAAESSELHLKPVLDSLLARVNGLDAQGKPLPDSDVPTQESFHALFAADENLSRPLEDEMLRVQFPQKDGSTLVKEVRFGDTWKKFQRHYEQKRAEMAKMKEAMQNLELEMRALKEEVVDGDEEMRDLVRTHEREMLGFQGQMNEAEKEYEEDVKRAKDDEKKAVKEFQKKFDRFMAEAMME